MSRKESDEEKIEVQRMITEKFQKVKTEPGRKKEDCQVRIVGHFEGPTLKEDKKEVILNLLELTIPGLEIDSVEIEKTTKKGSITKKYPYVP